jgi:hypothetical protein
LSQHGLHLPTIDEGLDLAKKTLLPVSQHFASPGHSLDDFGRSKMYIIQVGKRIKDKKKDFFGSKRSYTPFLSSYYGTLVRVAIGDSTCNACHNMVYICRPSMKV